MLVCPLAVFLSRMTMLLMRRALSSNRSHLTQTPRIIVNTWTQLSNSDWGLILTVRWTILMVGTRVDIAAEPWAIRQVPGLPGSRRRPQAFVSSGRRSHHHLIDLASHRQTTTSTIMSESQTMMIWARSMRCTIARRSRSNLRPISVRSMSKMASSLTKLMRQVDATFQLFRLTRPSRWQRPRRIRRTYRTWTRCSARRQVYVDRTSSLRISIFQAKKNRWKLPFRELSPQTSFKGRSHFPRTSSVTNSKGLTQWWIDRRNCRIRSQEKRSQVRRLKT